jgi:hypothetical protein
MVLKDCPSYAYTPGLPAADAGLRGVWRERTRRSCVLGDVIVAIDGEERRAATTTICRSSKIMKPGDSGRPSRLRLGDREIRDAARVELIGIAVTRVYEAIRRKPADAAAGALEYRCGSCARPSRI